jgi:hypothetical protein
MASAEVRVSEDPQVNVRAGVCYAVFHCFPLTYSSPDSTRYSHDEIKVPLATCNGSIRRPKLGSKSMRSIRVRKRQRCSLTFRIRKTLEWGGRTLPEFPMLRIMLTSISIRTKSVALKAVGVTVPILLTRSQAGVSVLQRPTDLTISPAGIQRRIDSRSTAANPREWLFQWTLDRSAFRRPVTIRLSRLIWSNLFVLALVIVVNSNANPAALLTRTSLALPHAFISRHLLKVSLSRYRLFFPRL